MNTNVPKLHKSLQHRDTEQALRQENGGVFCKKSGKWFFVKKWTFPQCRVHYVQYQYFLFYILLIWGCIRTPLPMGPGEEAAISTDQSKRCTLLLLH